MVDYTQKIKPYLEGVAPIEPTTTAASAHAVGDIFYLNGTKVKCTVTIAVGDTIAIGTNVTLADDVENEIRKINISLTPITATLAQGATSVTIQDARITTSSVVIPVSETFGLVPDSVTVTTGQVVMTYQAQAQAENVGVLVF